MDLPRRTLGRAGLVSSCLGLAGSFGIDADAVERAYDEFGLNHFFVSPRMKGLMEGIRRLVRRGLRDRLVIQSGSFMPLGVSIPRSWEKIARALDVETIDIFQIYWVRSRWFVGGRTWPTLRRLQEQGKVRALAISSHDRVLARALADELPLDALMVRYNAAHRGAEKEVFASLGESRPGIIVYTGTRWGRLLKPVAGLDPMTAAECYRFQLGHPKVDVALCGARNWDELRADAEGVLQGPLPAGRLDEVRRFGDAVRARPGRGMGW